MGKKESRKRNEAKWEQRRIVPGIVAKAHDIVKDYVQYQITSKVPPIPCPVPFIYRASL
jgi:hypothetical protein